MVAGEPFDVEVQIVDADDAPVVTGGIAVTITVDDGEFAGGSDEVIGSTDAEGIARFELAIETSGHGRVLTATSAWSELDEPSVESDSFDVVAADASVDNSAIYGEDGAVADGVDEADVSIELFDRFDNPVVDVVPEFQATGDGNEYGDCTSTDAGGFASCTMTSTDPGEKILEITAPVSVIGEPIAFVSPCDPENLPFGGGDGSASSPWRVCSPSHFDAIGTGNLFVGHHLVLYDDIDMADVEDFHVIGDFGDQFVGSFDGAGYTISNLSITADDDNNVGPFGVIGETGVVEDVVFEAVDITGRNNVGGLAGSNHGTIDAVTVAGSVDGSKGVGGLVGINRNAGTIQSSVAETSVLGINGTVGSFAGTNEGKISDSHAEGHTAMYDGSSLEGAGGFVGVASHGSLIERSSAAGMVIGESAQSASGGFVGWTSGDALFAESYTTVDVENLSGGTVGGFAGHLSGGTLTDCYATGFVESSVGSGGFVGEAQDGAAISRVYAAGANYGGPGSGGFAGELASSVEVDEAYWDQENSFTNGIGTGATQNDGVTGLMTDDFSDEEHFDFDFDTIWEIGDAPDGATRPVLQWQSE